MNDLLDFLERVNAATSIEAVWQELLAATEPFGFDRLLYGYTRFKSGNSFGNIEDVLILTNHPPEYTDTYIGERLYTMAPMVRWASENVGACSWNWMRRNAEKLSPSERMVAEFNLKMGVTAGWVVSFPSSSVRARGAIALTARRGIDQDQADAIWEVHGRVLHQMATAAHMKFAALPFTSSARQLTDRQREALEWVGDGKTTQDIATIMGLTPATIEKHLRLAREALDVDTTAQAVLKASFQNQIFVVQGDSAGTARGG